ncbi:MAG: hypothetical protein P9L91_00890, partial [Candidatus Zophobacter franzmannii]|nr:hypothetical protein [Candidatus Zophobacter franzmannii]
VLNFLYLISSGFSDIALSPFKNYACDIIIPLIKSIRKIATKGEMSIPWRGINFLILPNTGSVSLISI